MSDQEAIIDFANALESACVNLRMKLGEKTKETAGFTWNPDLIHWEKAEGSHGAYEKSEDVNNLHFKAMLADIADHKGKLTRDGQFYWVFNNGVTVGRKKKQ
jgi:hypothetical protein